MFLYSLLYSLHRAQKWCKVLLCHAPTRSKRLGPPADALNWLSLSQHTTPDAWHGLHWNSWHELSEKQLLVVTLPEKLDGLDLSLICLYLLACPRHLCRWHPSGSHFPVQLCKVCWNLSRYSTCKDGKLHKHMRARQFSLIRVWLLGVLQLCSSDTKVLTNMNPIHTWQKWPMLRGWNGTHLQTCSCHCLGSRSKRLTSSDIMTWWLNLLVCTNQSAGAEIHLVTVSCQENFAIQNVPGLPLPLPPLPLLFPPSGQSLALWQIPCWRKVEFVDLSKKSK